jgi:hypothetical protein
VINDQQSEQGFLNIMGEVGIRLLHDFFDLCPLESRGSRFHGSGNGEKGDRPPYGAGPKGVGGGLGSSFDDPSLIQAKGPEAAGGGREGRELFIARP